MSITLHFYWTSQIATNNDDKNQRFSTVLIVSFVFYGVGQREAFVGADRSRWQSATARI